MFIPITKNVKVAIAFLLPSLVLSYQSVKSEDRFISNTKIVASIDLERRAYWPGEEICGTVHLVNTANTPEYLPDLDDPGDGVFQVQEVSGGEKAFQSPQPTYLDTKRKFSGPKSFRRLEPNASLKVERSNPGKCAFTAPMWTGEFMLKHSYLGTLAKFSVRAPVIKAFAEIEWQSSDIKQEGMVVSKRFQRVFALQDEDLSAICYSTNPASSFQVDRFNERIKVGDSMSRLAAHYFASYKCEAIELRSVIQLEASIDKLDNLAIIYKIENGSQYRLWINRAKP